MDQFKRLTDAATLVREYAGSDASKQAIALLDALYDSYLVDLISVAPERLLVVQSAIKQVIALKQTFASEGWDVPKI